MNQDLSYTILKYVMLVIVLYALFKSFANAQMDDTDLLYIIVVGVIMYAIIKNLYDSYVLLPFNPKTFMNEHMADSNPNPVPVEINTELKTKLLQEEIKKQEELKKLEEIKKQEQQRKLQEELLKQEVIRKHQESVDILNKTDYIKRNTDGSYSIKPQINIQTEPTQMKSSDVISDELVYNYVDFNQIPYDDSKSNFEYGYSFIPPTNWFPVPTHPPVCVTTRRHNVCAIPTSGTDLNLKEWNSSRRISQPDNINVKYIKEKLNSGN